MLGDRIDDVVEVWCESDDSEHSSADKSLTDGLPMVFDVEVIA